MDEEAASVHAARERATTGLKCGICAATYPDWQCHLLCTCGGPLEQQYDFSQVGRDDRPRSGEGLESGVWRYLRLLPDVPGPFRVSLGEGMTPLVELRKRSASSGVRILIKDEGSNPTGSYKARGASVGASRLSYLGWRSLSVPTSGSGGNAWAAYGAAAGLSVSVGMPRLSEKATVAERMSVWFGANVSVYDEDLAGAYRRFRAQMEPESAYVAGFQEPYRLEGDKTLLYEVAEQSDWQVPDHIVFPTGGGIGLVAQAKALEELRAADWINSDAKATLIAAQHKDCAPLATALRKGALEPDRCTPSGVPISPGVWVADPWPGPYILQALRERSEVFGDVADDDQILECMKSVARTEGVLLGPEGALAVSVAHSLIQQGFICPGQTAVCVNTGSALRYPHLLQGL